MDAQELREGIVFRIAYADSPDSTTLSTSHDMHFRVDAGVMLYPEAAIEIWKRMVSLPNAEQMRCHLPRYGMHLNFGGGKFFTSAICWECNNISISHSGEYAWQTFDAQSDAAQTLLVDVRKYLSDTEPDS